MRLFLGTLKFPIADIYLLLYLGNADVRKLGDSGSKIGKFLRTTN